MTGYVYDGAFQNMAATGSAGAARRIIAAVRSVLPVRSVLDVGCARGTWLRQWQAQAVEDVTGVDGAYVDRARLEIEPARFVVRDLGKRLPPGQGGERNANEQAASFWQGRCRTAPGSSR